MLPDAANGNISDLQDTYPVLPFLIVGIATIFMYLIANVVPDLVSFVLLSSSNKSVTTIISKEVVSVIAMWSGILIHGIFEGLATGH